MEQGDIGGYCMKWQNRFLTTKAQYYIIDKKYTSTPTFLIKAIPTTRVRSYKYRTSIITIVPVRTATVNLEKYRKF